MTHLSNHALFICLILLVMISGFFSGSETAMTAINRYRLRHLAKQIKHPKYKVANRVLNLQERMDRLLGVILLGNTFANIMASAIATLLAQHLWGNYAVAIAMGVLTMVVLIFAEVMPKTIAAQYPEKFAFSVSIPLKLVLKALYPIVYLLNMFTNTVLAIFKIRIGKRELESFSREEFRTVLREAGKTIPRAHQNMLIGILDLEKVSVEDIMISRNEILGIDLSLPWEAILEDLSTAQHTRMPVFEKSIENVKGILHLRDALNLMVNEELTMTTLLSIVHEPYYVPEGTLLSAQVTHFKNERERVALVVDEYGALKGLITLEDILEEVIGEFTTDFAETMEDIHPQKDGSFLVDGGIHIRELNRRLQIELPTEGPKTLSGVITEYLEFMPEPDMGLSINGYRIEILSVTENRVKTVRMLIQ